MSWTAISMKVRTDIVFISKDGRACRRKGLTAVHCTKCIDDFLAGHVSRSRSKKLKQIFCPYVQLVVAVQYSARGVTPLIRSMPRRMQAVITARRKHTDY